MKRMTDAEIEYYIKQVDRRGNALKKDEAVRIKYAAEFEKINNHLANNWKRFVVSCVVRRNRCADRTLWREFVEREEHELIAKARKAKDDGDCENFCWIVWLVHLKYMTMWRDKH